MALPYGTRPLDIIAFLSEWVSSKKRFASITHKYSMAVEMLADEVCASVRALIVAYKHDTQIPRFVLQKIHLTAEKKKNNPHPKPSMLNYALKMIPVWVTNMTTDTRAFSWSILK